MSWSLRHLKHRCWSFDCPDVTWTSRDDCGEFADGLLHSNDRNDNYFILALYNRLPGLVMYEEGGHQIWLPTPALGCSLHRRHLVALIYRLRLRMVYNIWVFEQGMTQGLSECCVRNKPCFRQTLESGVSNVPPEY
jgi:hypothetical protein